MYFPAHDLECHLLQVKDEQADAVKKRIRQWESENRVLGHHARSDVHRPRALLVLSGEGVCGDVCLRADVCSCFSKINVGRVDKNKIIHHLS